MSLDIIIAIRALNGHAKEEQEQTFINILRNKLNGKDTAKDWVYYLLNLYEGQKYDSAIACIKNLDYLLKTGEEYSSIVLDGEHYRVINLRDGYQLNPDGTTESNNPIEKYLGLILNNLIPRIDRIDEEFFCKATTIYDDINKKFADVLKLMRSMHLKKYDDYGRINQQIEELQKALALENAKNPKIFSEIKHNIDEFCQLSDGILVAKVFEVDNAVFSDSDDFFENNKNAVFCKYDEGGYNSNYDFQTYSLLKEGLAEAIKENIRGRINPEEAEKLLDRTKETIAKVFIQKGKMGFITTSPQEWFPKAIDIMENEGCYPHLLGIISSFANHTVQTTTIIEPRIKTVILKCMHHDNFGDPDDYDFQEYENAAAAIVHSLFEIENYAKGLINDGLISDDIEQLQVEFSDIYFRLTKLAVSKEPHKLSPIHDELYHFYENHGAEVFKDNEDLLKRGLVTSWMNKIT